MQIREQLLGYLLGALDQDEHREVLELLQQRPSLESELNRLRGQLAPLADAKIPFAPPSGLAERTMAHLGPKPADVVQPAARSARRPWSAADHRFDGERAWSIVDVLVAAAVLLAAVSIFLPAIQQSRAMARRVTCQNTLAQFGFAFAEYAQNDPFGRLPRVEASGPGAFPGQPVIVLREATYLPADARTVCPSSPQAFRRLQPEIPTIQEMAGASDADLALMQSNVCGSYAYPLGVIENGEVVAPKHQQRPDFGLMADSPRWTEDNEIRAVNHNGQGFNMLFEDGRVWYCLADAQWSDHPYLNKRGHLAPGIDVHDAVLGGGQLIRVAN